MLTGYILDITGGQNFLGCRPHPTSFLESSYQSPWCVAMVFGLDDDSVVMLSTYAAPGFERLGPFFDVSQSVELRAGLHRNRISNEKSPCV